MKKTLVTLIITLIYCITFGQANKLFRQASKTVDLNEKIELLSQVIDLEPKNLDAYFYRALAKNDLGDYSGAIVDYSKIIIIQPDADTYYNRGNSRYSLKDYTGAQEDYENAFNMDSNFIDALYSLGCVKYDLGDFEEAIEDFSKVISMAPRMAKTYYLRASANTALEKYTNALQDYSLAILIDSSADSYYNRGVFYLKINYYQKANSDFNNSISLNNSNSFAYFYRGTSFLFLGKYVDAISDFNMALKFDPLDFDAMLGLSISYYKANDFENAKLYVKKAETILSTNSNSTNIEDYKNTYWYQNQFFFFNENFVDLLKIN